MLRKFCFAKLSTYQSPICCTKRYCTSFFPTFTEDEKQRTFFSKNNIKQLQIGLTLCETANSTFEFLVDKQKDVQFFKQQNPSKYKY